MSQATELTPPEVNALRFARPDSYLRTSVVLTLAATGSVSHQCSPTTSDGQGPYYLQNAEADVVRFPARREICTADPVCTSCGAHPGYQGGLPLNITGSVRSSDCQPLQGPNVVVEVWQADPTGTYWNEADTWTGRRLSHLDPHHYNCRAHATGGTFDWTTYVPGQYVSFAPRYRARHLHIRARAPGHTTVVTQLYFPGDEVLADGSDSAACPICSSEDTTRHLQLELMPAGTAFDLCLLPELAGEGTSCLAGCTSCSGGNVSGTVSGPRSGPRSGHVSGTGVLLPATVGGVVGGLVLLGLLALGWRFMLRPTAKDGVASAKSETQSA